MKIQKMALLALYTTIALTIFMIESAIPPLLPIPGIKMGLANIVTLLVLMHYSWKDALLVLVMRVVIASMFAGQMVSFAYSLSGGLLCLLAMTLLYHFFGRKYLVQISIVGAIGHNIGQMLIASVIFQSFSIIAYFPVLMLSAIVTGAFTGLCTIYAAKYIPFPNP